MLGTPQPSWKSASLAALAMTAILTTAAFGEPMKPTHLRCEYLIDPLGIDVTQPRLSWELSSEGRAKKQSAYRILVASTPDLLENGKADLWDSGKVETSRSTQIVYGGAPLSSRTVCLWKVQTWDEAGSTTPWSEPAAWSMGLLQDSDWRAEWIGVEAPAEHTDDPLPAQMLRKEFTAPEKIRKARVHVTALGVYELRLNGERVGDHILAPEWTDYEDRVMVQTYDVSELVAGGENALAAHLGDGWYSGRIGLANIVPDPKVRALYGPRPRLLVQLEIEDQEGNLHQVFSDSSWKVTTEGPIRTADILDGETYDARRELPGWDRPGFDDSRWDAVSVMKDYPGELVAQMNEPVRVITEIHPVSVSEPEPGTFVFDMGQNMIGWCEIRVQSKPGQEIRLRHAEVLNPDGTLYRENLRMPKDGGPWGARQEDRYICRGEDIEVFQPHFTFHGFRFVEVQGLEEKPGLDFLTGKVFCSSAPDAGEFECSNPMLNRLMQNILWTLRANLVGVPTDCPQRDERLGWMGDAQVFGPAACFQLDMAAFWTKWIRDVRDAQAQDGRYPDFAPHPFDPDARFSGVPAWGDAGVIVPWVVYNFYGDTRILETHFDSAKRWVDYIHEKNPDLLWKNSRGNDYGDWLNADTFIREGWPRKGGEVPKEVFATLMFAHSTDLLARMAEVLDRNEETEVYSKLAANIRKAFCQAYVDEDAKIEGDTQAGYALALAFDMLPSELRPKAVDHLLAALEKYNTHISTGFISTIQMMKQLTERGHNDIAYRLINNKTFPSWGYTIEQGATTIWERWDGYVEGTGFQDPGMNSFSHYAIGAVGEWMVRTILGINPDPNQPGFEHFHLKPLPGGGLSWAKGSYRSHHGTIAVEWKTSEEGALAVRFEIPANTSATVELPAASTSSVTESGKPLAQVPGAGEVESMDGIVRMELGSGIYQFEIAGNKR